MNPVETEPRPSVFREAHLRDYWKVIWQGRWTIIAIFVLVVGVTAVWSFLQTPVYRATATIEVQPQARQLAAGRDVSGLGAAGYGWLAEEKYHNTQVEIIRSRDVANRVAAALDLSSDPVLTKSPDPVEAFRKLLRVTPRRETGLIEISISGTDREKITHWVNEVANAYVERNLERARGNVTHAIDTIRHQMTELQDEFSQAESERFEALLDTKVLNSEEQVDIVNEQLKTFNSELTQVQIELSNLRSTLDRISTMKSSNELMSLPILAEDETLSRLLSSKVELERQHEADKVELRPNHPDYEKTLRELSKVEQRIEEQVGVLVGSLRNRYELAKKKETYLKEQISDAENFSLRVARASSNYGVYKSRAETTMRILELIGKTMTEVQFGAELLNNNVQLLDAATVPLYPIAPRKKLNVAIGIVLGLFLGVAGAFFLEYLDNTFRTPEDIEKYLGLSVLGVIPKLQEQEGLANRAVREAYQSLRTSIIFSSKNRRRKVILISSTGPQEGKSSTVANLGRMLATAGDRVMIMDCDLRRPTQHLHHKVDRDSGITNYVSAPLERTDWNSFVKVVGPGNLHVLTCGPIPPSPPELLGADRFNELIQSLRQSYDWVLLDSPPAASLADATLLAAVADMLVLVVQHNHTDRDLVIKTMQRLRAVNPAIAGAVLNNVDLDRAYDKDYYYAGYYYYVEGEGKDASKRRARSSAKVG